MSVTQPFKFDMQNSQQSVASVQQRTASTQAPEVPLRRNSRHEPVPHARTTLESLILKTLRSEEDFEEADPAQVLPYYQARPLCTEEQAAESLRTKLLELEASNDSKYRSLTSFYIKQERSDSCYPCLALPKVKHRGMAPGPAKYLKWKIKGAKRDASLREGTIQTFRDIKISSSPDRRKTPVKMERQEATNITISIGTTIQKSRRADTMRNFKSLKIR